MKRWGKDDGGPRFTPPNHFGGLEVRNLVPLEGSNFSVQLSHAPKGAGGEMHHHDDWAQLFYVLKGQLTFDTGAERFTLLEGESVLFEPKDPHATLNEGDDESVSMVITIVQ